MQIVENAGQPSRTGKWRVSPTPVLRLGTQEGSGPEEFTTVAATTRLSNGDIVVLERSSSELRFFDGEGVFERMVGGRGSGPGEFGMAVTMSRLQGDTLAVRDMGRMSLNLFTADGRFVGRQQSFLPAAFPDVHWSKIFCGALPILPGGGVLGCIEPVAGDPGEAVARSGVQRDPTRQLVAAPRDLGSLDTLGIYEGAADYRIEMGDGFVFGGHPFLPDPFIAVGASPPRVFVANNPEYSIEVWDPTGHLRRIIRRTDARRRPTDAETDSAWRMALEGQLPELEARVRSAVGTIDLLPAVLGLAAGPDGELWVKREPLFSPGAGATFDVFDAAGAFLGPVETPVDLELREVGRDYLLGTMIDRFEVPYVVLLRLVRS